MSSINAQILALMEAMDGMTAEQLTAIQQQAKKQKKTGKNEKQLWIGIYRFNVKCDDDIYNFNFFENIILL
jgi:hypothetical protein